MKRFLILGAIVGSVGFAISPNPIVAGKKAVKGQPHMRKALKALQTAESELQISKHNKGGHRVKALKLVRQAIKEVKEGGRHAKGK